MKAFFFLYLEITATCTKVLNVGQAAGGSLTNWAPWGHAERHYYYSDHKWREKECQREIERERFTVELRRNRRLKVNFTLFLSTLTHEQNCKQ